MNFPTFLYFISVLLTFLLTGFVAWYAWRQKPRPGVRAYAWLSLGECLLSLVELLSLLSRSQAQAQFWFNLRFLFMGSIAVLFLIFTLEYQGYRGWLSRTPLALGFIIPVLTQAFIWVPGLHGFWVKQDVGFYQSGPFWMNYPGARIPSVWFLLQSFYSDGLLLAGLVLILLKAWRMRRDQLAQALLLAGGALVSLVVSLISALNLFPQISFNPFIPGLGISAGLYALAIFRFQIFKRSPAREDGTPLTGLDIRERRSLATFILIFIVLVGGIAAIGMVSYQRYEDQFRLQVDGQLTAVAALKVDELESWRSERLGDADILFNNPAFAAQVGSFLGNSANAPAAAQVQAWLAALQTGEHYDRVFLLDPHGVERLASPNTPGPVSPYLAGQAVAALGQGQVTFMDFYRDTPSGPIYISLLVPIYAEGLRSRPLGVLVLRINPALSLYPFLGKWPTTSSTAETLLVRRDGNNVLYLNDLKFAPTAALTLSIPLAQARVLAVKAALGQTGVVEGMDYRGHPVIGYVGPVPGSPWFLVARMDTSEVYAPLRERLWEMLLFFGILILAAGAGLLLLWRQQSLRYYRGQVAAAQALRDSETRYRRLFEAARDGILILDAETGVVVDVNPFLVELLGFPREEIVGKELWELGFFKDTAASKAHFLELQQKEYIRYEDLPLETADGQQFEVEFTSNVYDSGDRRVFQCNIRDITERRQVETRLAQLAAIVESSDDAILGKTLDGLITSWNAGAERLYGYSAQEILGKPVSMLIPPDRPDELPEILNRIKRGESIRHYETVRQRHDGSQMDVSITVSPIKDASGQIIGASTIARDITARKRAEQELQTYSEHLEEMVNERTRALQDAQEKMIRQERLATLGQLAGSVGHELRNPLGVISNAVYFLKLTQPDATATVLEYLDIIEKETRTSDKIVTDLLDFTRIKSVDREPAQVSDLLEQTLQRYPLPGTLEVQLDLPPDLPPVYADPAQVVQVLGNLVTNACQAMAAPGGVAGAGKLTLSASLQGDMIAIAVQDSGMGISPENMGKLFEPLFTTKTKGIGLGLAVSQKLTEANGGRIEAHSQLGKGTTFKVYLPVYLLKSDSRIVE